MYRHDAVNANQSDLLRRGTRWRAAGRSQKTGGEGRCTGLVRTKEAVGPVQGDPFRAGYVGRVHVGLEAGPQQRTQASRDARSVLEG